MESHKEKTKDRLALVIEGPRIGAVEFVDKVKAFLDLISEVARDVTGKSKNVHWVVDVRSGSIDIGFTPEVVDGLVTVIPPLLDSIEEGIACIESKAVRPTNFSDEALRKARLLAPIVDAEHAEAYTVMIMRNGKQRTISAQTVAHVDAILERSYRDWGSVEGRLQTLSERGTENCVVYDSISDRPVKCYFREGITREVVEAFGKRVYISGLIRYRADGQMTSVEVEHFETFPEPETLPGIMDVYGILGATD